MAPKPDTLTPNDGGLQLPNSPKSSLQTLASRSRSPGHGRIRKPAVEWNNADEIDDGQDEPLEASDDDGQDLATLGEEVEKKSPSGGRIIDLLDIARPAKPKGEIDLCLYDIYHVDIGSMQGLPKSLKLFKAARAS